MKLCLANSQNVNREAIEPVGSPTIYRDFLERHGEEVQHLAFNRGGSPFAERLAAFEARGFEAVQTRLHNGGVRFACFEATWDLGVIAGVHDIPPGASLVEPEGWCPAAPPG